MEGLFASNRVSQPKPASRLSVGCAYPVAIDLDESTEARREWPGQTMLKATLICVRRKRFKTRPRRPRQHGIETENAEIPEQEAKKQMCGK